MDTGRAAEWDDVCAPNKGLSHSHSKIASPTEVIVDTGIDPKIRNAGVTVNIQTTKILSSVRVATLGRAATITVTKGVSTRVVANVVTTITYIATERHDGHDRVTGW